MIRYKYPSQKASKKSDKLLPLSYTLHNYYTDILRDSRYPDMIVKADEFFRGFTAESDKVRDSLLAELNRDIDINDAEATEWQLFGEGSYLAEITFTSDSPITKLKKINEICRNLGLGRDPDSLWQSGFAVHDIQDGSVSIDYNYHGDRLVLIARPDTANFLGRSRR